MMTRLFIKRAYQLISRVVFGFGIIAGVNFAGAQTEGQVQVAPGVAWENFALSDGPLNYNIIRAEVADPRVTLETESGKDALFKGEKVLDSVVRESRETGAKVLAGVNADFWSSSERLYTPIGLLVADGMIYTMPGKRSVFLFTEDEKSYMGKVSMTVNIGIGEKKLKINSINPTSRPKGVALYTPPFGKELAPMAGRRYMLVMEGDEFLPNRPLGVKVTQVSSETTTSLTAGTMILQVSPESVRTATGVIKDRAGATVVAKIPQVKGVVRSACGGGPVLVRDGKPDIRAEEEEISASFVTTKHPRTAIGVTRDQKNVFLVTVDGRQPKLSVGADLNELAEFMASLGCWQAMNLDGGGSTSMVVGNKVVNKPSDLSGARTVANSILVVLTDDNAETESGSSQGPEVPAQAIESDR